MSNDLRKRKGAEAWSRQSTEKYVGALAEAAPDSLKGILQSAVPYCGKAVDLADKSIPYFNWAAENASSIWTSLQPYKPDLLLPALLGVILCFFGGSYLTIIAALEAYKICGYETSLKCAKNLFEDFKRVAKANKEDDAKDENNDGVADVLAISNTDMVKRKVMLFLTTVEPNRLTEALTGLHAGFLAVVATLKLDFAKAMTLGHAIGTIVERPAINFFAPILEKVLPPEFKKWVVPTISYVIKAYAMSLAWMMQRVISTFHSAIRGGNMFSRNIIEYLAEMKILTIDPKETYLDELVGYSLALMGLWFQLSLGFSVPFPLNLVLFPFSCLEWFLMWATASEF